VTICTKDRECVLGEISGSKMNLNEIGKVSDRIWHEIPEHFPNAEMDQLVVMPNHLHGIIEIKEQKNCGDSASHRGLITGRGLINQTPTPDQISDDWILMKNPKITLGKIVRFFKAKSALEIRSKMGNYFCWQRNYYEHIIHEKNELSRIRKYIRENPVNWPVDEDNPVSYMKG
jgi:putative transposase